MALGLALAAPWLPSRQRAFGQGFQHSGARLGAAFAPTLVVFLIAHFGWRGVFYLFGGVGDSAWRSAWYLYYRDFPHRTRGVNQAELALLDKALRAHPELSPPFRGDRILRSRDLLFLSLMYFCYGWVFWMYSVAAHLPRRSASLRAAENGARREPSVAGRDRHERRRRLALRPAGPRSGAICAAAGWSSPWPGSSLAGLAILPGVLANNANTGLACLTLALAGLELTVAVAWAICLDIGGDYCGSVTGVMNTLGNLGGALSAVMIGYLATIFGWTVPFIVSERRCAASAALLATRIDPNRSAVAEFQGGV